MAWLRKSYTKHVKGDQVGVLSTALIKFIENFGDGVKINRIGNVTSECSLYLHLFGPDRIYLGHRIKPDMTMKFRSYQSSTQRAVNPLSVVTQLLIDAAKVDFRPADNALDAFALLR